MEKNIHVLWNYMLKYLELKEYSVCNSYKTQKTKISIYTSEGSLKDGSCDPCLLIFSRLDLVTCF